MNRPLRHLMTFALIAPLALGACADVEDQEMEMPADTATTGMDEMSTVPAEPMTADIESVGDFEVSGEATTLHQRDSVTLTLDLDGLDEGMQYEAALMSGTCPDDGGIAGTGIGEDEGEADQPGQQNRITDLSLTVTGGTGTASTVIPASQLPQGQEAHIAVTTTDGETVACGEVETRDTGMTGTTM